jgi:glutathione S-transferase
MSVAILLAPPLSPSSEKARWALDHHEVDYVEKTTLPVLRAPVLRWKLRRVHVGSEPTIPVLFDSRGALITDSFDIAHYAERTGGGTPLFRRGHEAEIARWNQLSERILAEADELASARLAEAPTVRQALATQAPRGLAGLLGPAARAMRLLRRKVLAHVAREPELTGAAAHRARLRASLLQLRGALDGRRYLAGDELSYSDIAMAVALTGIEPINAPHLPLAPSARRSSTDFELAGEFTDLLGWRDEIYGQHRARGSGPRSGTRRRRWRR